MARTTAKTLSNRRPRLLVIAGATGVGKSTASIQLAAKLGISRCLSTDAIREIMRAADERHDHPHLHRSSFSMGESGDPLSDWNDTCTAVEPGIYATIARARREGIDLLIEGVHIVPAQRILSSWEESGGIALGVLMVVHDEQQHQSMLKMRDAHSFRRADRYLAGFARIRMIQDGLIERAKVAQWPMIDPTRVESDVDKISDLLWDLTQS